MSNMQASEAGHDNLVSDVEVGDVRCDVAKSLEEYRLHRNAYEDESNA